MEIRELIHKTINKYLQWDLENFKGFFKKENGLEVIVFQENTNYIIESLGGEQTPPPFSLMVRNEVGVEVMIPFYDQDIDTLFWKVLLNLYFEEIKYRPQADQDILLSLLNDMGVAYYQKALKGE